LHGRGRSGYPLANKRRNKDARPAPAAGDRGAAIKSGFIGIRSKKDPGAPVDCPPIVRRRFVLKIGDDALCPLRIAVDDHAARKAMVLREDNDASLRGR
jgi:hypothetical protein